MRHQPSVCVSECDPNWPSHKSISGKAEVEEVPEKEEEEEKKNEENGISDFKSRQFVNQLLSEEIASQVHPAANAAALRPDPHLCNECVILIFGSAL